MGKITIVLTVFLSVLLFGCASQNAYDKSMFVGKGALNTGDYKEAEQDFLKAAQIRPDARSYAFAATAAYRAGDLAGAERLTEQAEKLDGKSYAYLRILGYRALILLAEGKKKEGLDALGVYLAAYRNTYPLDNIGRVERMLRTGQVDLPLLDRLIDEQVSTYESDLEEFWRTGNGFYGQRYGNPGMTNYPD